MRPFKFRTKFNSQAMFWRRSIARWNDTAKELSTRYKDVFMYFKHEDEGKRAEFGALMLRRLAEA